MYIAADGWDAGLRQGDVIGPIILPLVGKDIQILAGAPSLSVPAPEQPYTQLIIKGESRYVAVVSHDCEFNEEKRNKLLVARIQDVPGNLSGEQRTRLRESNDLLGLLKATPNAKVAGVDSFVLDRVPNHFNTEQVINFATITPLPMAMKADLRATKRAEMTEEDRVRFKAKLAWFFGRKLAPAGAAEAAEPHT